MGDALRSTVVGIVAIVLMAPGAARADTAVAVDGGSFHVEGDHWHHAETSGSDSSQTWASEPCSLHPIACHGIRCPAGQAAVLAFVTSGPTSIGPQCMGGATTITKSSVLRAFRRVGVPTPVLHVQPVGGRTLVNLRTNFYATGGAAFSRTVRLLGQRVVLRIGVARYVFRFGDGHDLATTDPGAAYPRLRDTHVYLRAGTVRVSLETTWSAMYRVGSAPWRRVDGTVTRTAPEQRLRVITATPVLTAPR